jgi:hypothetical protein
MSHDKTEFERAGEDLADISELRKSQGFNRYYLSRLDGKIDALKNLILHDQSKKGDELEGLRNQLWALEDLRKAPDRDYAQCLKISESLS